MAVATVQQRLRNMKKEDYILKQLKAQVMILGTVVLIPFIALFADPYCHGLYANVNDIIMGRYVYCVSMTLLPIYNDFKLLKLNKPLYDQDLFLSCELQSVTFGAVNDGTSQRW